MLRFILFTLLLFSGNSVQASNIRIQSYGLNSIIQGGIVDLRFDNNGFLWIITNEGILRFDGQNVKEFNKNNTTILKDSRFGNFNVNGGILSETGKAYEIDITSGTLNFVNVERKIFNNLWALNQIEKTAYIKKNKLYKITKTLQYDIDSLRYCSYFEINNHKGYILNQNELIPTFGSIKKVGLFENSQGLKNGIFGGIFYSTNQLKETVYFYNESGRLDPQNLFYSRQLSKRLNNERTFFHVTSSKKTFLILGNELYELNFDGKKLSSKIITSNLSIKNICSIDYLPKENIIAIGSYSEGLFILKDKLFDYIQTSNGQNNFIEYSCLPIFQNKIIHSSGRLYDLKLRKCTPFLNLDLPSRAYIDDYKGNLWYYYRGKLTIVDRNQKLIKTIDLKQFKKSTNTITKFQKDKSGNIWFCNDQIIAKVNSQNHQITDYSRFKLLKGELIESFHLFDTADILIGTNKRLFKLNLNSGKTTNLIRDKHVRSFYQDKDGIIWIGTYGDGYYLYKNQKTFKIPLDDRGYLSSVHGVLIDGLNRVWISTNKGLFSVPKSTILNSIGKDKFIEYTWYSHFDGLPGNEFNGGCYPSAFEHENNFYFPSMNGLVFFNPNKINTTSFKLNIIPNNIFCDGEEIRKNVGLSPDFGRIIMDFSIPYWGKSENLMIEYKLKNSSNSKWHQINLGEKVVLSNLAHGNYSLIIRVSDKNGNVIDFYQTQFTVLPFFYQTKLFYFGLVLLFFVVVYLLFKLRLKILIKEKQILQKQVSKQVKQIYDSNKELEHALFQLQEMNQKLEWSNYFRAKLVSVFIHDLKSPLHFLSKVTKRIKDNPDSINRQELEETSTDLYNYSQSIISYIDQFLVWQTVNQNNWNLNIEEINVHSLFENLINSYGDIIKRQNNTIQISVDPKLTVRTDQQLIVIVLRNLIDNANKYSQNINIILSAVDSKTFVLIEVKDNGCGLSNETISEIKNSLKSGQLGRSHEKVGYKIIGDFCQLMKVKVDIHSKGFNKGTTITLKVPKE